MFPIRLFSEISRPSSPATKDDPIGPRRTSYARMISGGSIHDLMSSGKCWRRWTLMASSEMNMSSDTSLGSLLILGSSNYDHDRKGLVTVCWEISGYLYILCNFSTIHLPYDALLPGFGWPGGVLTTLGTLSCIIHPPISLILLVQLPVKSMHHAVTIFKSGLMMMRKLP